LGIAVILQERDPPLAQASLLLAVLAVTIDPS
jgi:hypothetical protein